MTEKIEKLWFDGGRICILTDCGEKLSRPLEAFPCLKDATAEERASFVIGRFGDDVRWECIDEDIHISNFHEQTEPNPDNEVARLFAAFPLLDVAKTAQYIGISKDLLSKYIYGIKQPSEQRLQQIKSAFHSIGSALMAV